jgi:hypothetical protein
MGLKLAFQAFFKALREPEKAEKFLTEKQETVEKKVDNSHLHLLGLLQGSGRLVDFLQEDLSGCNDAQIGAAARKVHTDCQKALEEVVTIRPLLEEEEGTEIHVPEGYDVSSLRVTGNVTGNAPYKGYLVHRGWRAHKQSLPKKVGEQSAEVLCQAEVEIR